MLQEGAKEGADGAGGRTGAFPWRGCTPVIADDIFRTGDLMPPTSFEFRAGRDALALTVFLSDTENELSGIRHHPAWRPGCR
ncbi:hypothetical protein SVIOM342S_03011 [Streptomyces violaceorubidus]